MKVFTKDPESTLDYGVDWSNALVSSTTPSEDETISTSEWILEDISGDTVDLSASSSTFSNNSSDKTNKTVVYISGGTVNHQYLVKNKITTNKSRTDARSFRLKVEHV